MGKLLLCIFLFEANDTEEAGLVLAFYKTVEVQRKFEHILCGFFFHRCSFGFTTMARDKLILVAISECNADIDGALHQSSLVKLLSLSFMFSSHVSAIPPTNFHFTFSLQRPNPGRIEFRPG